MYYTYYTSNSNNNPYQYALYIEVYLKWSAAQKEVWDQYFFNVIKGESLLLTKAVFIQSKRQKKQEYCEILLQFLILVSYLIYFQI